MPQTQPLLQLLSHITGQALFDTPGTFTWTAPAGVTSVSAVCVGGGGGAGTYIRSLGSDQPGGAGGGGGELHDKHTALLCPHRVP
jgi:hypothetical protein